ncbi:retron St85 family RNA-directed DNA polymerase [Chloroflexota bacterium]
MISHSTRYLFPNTPKLDNLSDISIRTHLSTGLLYKLSKRSEYYYRVYKLKKRSKGEREIAEPSRAMKAVQSWILVNILDQIPLPKQATGFRKDSNILKNAEPHQVNEYILCIDIEDFFPSITYSNIYTIFYKLGYSKHVCHILTSFCTFKNRLPQGGVTSPALSNLSCIRLDHRISGYCGTRNVQYTRYADDITLSSMSSQRLTKAYRMVEYIIEDEGFTLNHAKTRYMGPKRRRKVTGLVIGDNGAGIGRQEERKLQTEIFYLFKVQGSMDIEEAIIKLQGKLAFLYSVDNIRYRRIIKYINKLSGIFQTDSMERKLN